VVETPLHAEDYPFGVGWMEREVVVEELEGAGVLGAVELAAVPEVSTFL
jgi:hypothetical protein